MLQGLPEPAAEDGQSMETDVVKFDQFSTAMTALGNENSGETIAGFVGRQDSANGRCGANASADGDELE